MRKGVIWMGAIAGALLAAGGWVFEFALSKGAAFIYAVVVSLVANVVFDYVREPEAPPAKTAAAMIRPAGPARAANAVGEAPPTHPAASAEAALPAAARSHPPAIISPVPIHPLTPLAPPPAGATAAKPPAPPQRTALAASPAPATSPTSSPAPASAPSLTIVTDPAPAQPPAPGPGSGGLY